MVKMPLIQPPAAALLLAGVPAQAGSSAGAPASEPRRLAESTAQTEEAQQLEKRRLEEQRSKLEQQQQETQLQTQPRRMRTRGPMPDAATPRPGKSRFGAGVVRDKESPGGD